MPKEPPQRIQTKYDRLEFMLLEQAYIPKECESQANDIYNEFVKWTQINLPDLSSQSSKKGRKRNIEAILEKNEECESPVDSNASEPEDTRRKHCNGENESQSSTVVNGNDEGKRSKRAASKAAESLISKQVNISIGQKMRRPDNFSKFEVQIKMEKLSLGPSNDKEKSHEEKKDEFAVPKNVPRSRPKKLMKYDEPTPNNDLSNVVIKQEKEDKGRSTRKPRTKNATKNKTQRERSKQRSSNQTDDEDEVQIEIPKGVVVTISDSEEEMETNDKNKPKNKKKSIVDKSVNETSEKTELKNANETGNENSVYEDAQDQVSAAAAAPSPSLVQACFVRLENIDDQDVNLTYDVRNELKVSKHENQNTPDIQPQTAMNNTVNLNKEMPMNNTIVLNKDAPMNNTIVLNKDAPMNNTVVLHKETPDRRFESPLKSLNDNTFNVKDQDAMLRNKKVEQDNDEEESKPVQRITRTKKKAIDAAAAAAAHTEGKENVYKKGAESQNTKTAKHQTPNVNQYDSSKSKSKLNNVVTNMQSFIPKSGSAIKLLKSADLREKREEDSRKKLEKEEEVQKKKEAMMLAKVEEQKKKREEKALRAQQTREQIEKERQMKVEKEEREKQEKIKQIQAERETYKKELARKRALAEKRIQENEERRRAEDVARQQRLQTEQEEVEKRLEAQRKRDQEELEKRRLQEEYEQAKAKAKAKKLAAKSKQLTKPNKAEEATVAAKTETVFDLDTDAETDDEEHPRAPIPVWSKQPYRILALEKQSQIPTKIISDLFGSKPTSIDLRAVFPSISENRLRRQSSAVWNTPPRYSLMPKDY
ncbi:inner centromere protein B-like [Chrysoperla carnea]|uniref:inner centromere protein B-like n=1 Tax=Chrysoperla carnea TaxID=189513 RepID=UPI001D078F84|nr:inner centromere protein B-like [Chrysoperla carnea]